MPAWVQLAIGAAALLAIWDRLKRTGTSVIETIAEVPDKIAEAVETYEKVHDAYGGTKVLCHRAGQPPHPIYWPAGEEPPQEEIDRILKMYGCTHFTADTGDGGNPADMTDAPEGAADRGSPTGGYLL